MGFRSSPYIDFETGTVIMPPMTLSEQRKRPRSLVDMLDLFECRVDVWQFGPAVAMLKKIEADRVEQPSSVWTHAAYALLNIVFTYFEMLGKTLNPDSKARGSARIDFLHGFCDVYPEFRPASGGLTDTSVPDVKEFRDRARNGIYHLGYTKGNLFIWDEPSRPDFFVDRQHRDHVYYVNPHGVTRTIVAHFPGFMNRLRHSPPGSPELERFRRFFTEFHGIT